MRRLLLVLAATLAALIPTAAFAQESDNDDEGDLAIRVNGDYRVRPGEVVSTLIVISGNAIIEGEVEDALFVIDGTADVHGTVGGDLTVISGDLILRNQATANNVTLIRSDMERAAGSQITGDLTRRSEVFFSGAGIFFGIVMWLGLTAMAMVVALVFAAVGGRQLGLATENMGGHPGGTILTALIGAVVLPILAMAVMFTLIGIPLGVTMLVVAGPALLFLGYVVAGTWLGGLILGAARGGAPREHPYAPALLGVAILQVVALIPGLGWAAALAFALWGFGALVYTAWRAMRGGGAAPAVTTRQVPPSPASPAPFG